MAVGAPSPGAMHGAFRIFGQSGGEENVARGYWFDESLLASNDGWHQGALGTMLACVALGLEGDRSKSRLPGGFNDGE